MGTIRQLLEVVAGVRVGFVVHNALGSHGTRARTGASLRTPSAPTCGERLVLARADCTRTGQLHAPSWNPSGRTCPGGRTWGSARRRLHSLLGHLRVRLRRPSRLVGTRGR